MWKNPDFNLPIKPFNGRLGILGYLRFLFYVKNINRGRFNFI